MGVCALAVIREIASVNTNPYIAIQMEHSVFNYLIICGICLGFLCAIDIAEFPKHSLFVSVSICFIVILFLF